MCTTHRGWGGVCVCVCTTHRGRGSVAGPHPLTWLAFRASSGMLGCCTSPAREVINLRLSWPWSLLSPCTTGEKDHALSTEATPPSKDHAPQYFCTHCKCQLWVSQEHTDEETSCLVVSEGFHQGLTLSSRLGVEHGRCCGNVLEVCSHVLLVECRWVMSPQLQ